MRTILHLCADIGSDSWPYRSKPGYEVVTVGSDYGVENYTPDREIWGIIANPVCTSFSQLRRRPSWAGAWDDASDGLWLVDECLRVIREANPAFWVLENPATGSLRKHLGAPTATYQPYEYGSPWSKKTALWGDFNMPERTHSLDDVEQIGGLWVRPGRRIASLAYQHRSAFNLIPEFVDSGMPAPSSDSDFRSLCSQRFAEAFAAVNP